jgi:hypothetical protein
VVEDTPGTIEPGNLLMMALLRVKSAPLLVMQISQSCENNPKILGKDIYKQ